MENYVFIKPINLKFNNHVKINTDTMHKYYLIICMTKKEQKTRQGTKFN